ncbi:MAG: DUF4421 family protein [Microscillaceae bacterium]|nr:DUF4421 family protein [Microscillaceae bacterium]
MKRLLFFALLLIVHSLQAQKDSTKYQRKNFETFNDYILLRASLHNNSLNLSLSPRENGITQYLKPIWYRPSVQNNLGFGISFKGLSLSYSFKLRQNSLISARQGKSQYQNIQIHSFGKKLGYDIYYQDYKGYFISSLNDFFNRLFNAVPLERRDDLRLRNIGANVQYIFSPHKFSYRSAFVFDERQTKSGGSFTLTGSLAYFRAAADSSFIPTDKTEFDPKAHFSKAEFYTFTAAPGYAYNIIFPKGFYISLAASGMVGLQYFEARSDQLSDDGLSYLLKGIGRASIGYHVRKWVTGIAISADIQGMNTKYVQFRSNNLDLSVFLAYRIKTGWMKDKKSFFEIFKKKKETTEG